MKTADTRKLEEDLNLLNYPPPPWVLPNLGKGAIFDVIIIGGGMAGLAASFALLQQGISNIRIYDESPEGPWKTYARMLTLRSGKELIGPALNIPHLTFQAWYTAIYGEDKWKALYKIPTHTWMEYLHWYRRVLKLPVFNEHRLLYIRPENSSLILEMEYEGLPFAVQTRKIVLATGRKGFGGNILPPFINSLPRNIYAHTSDYINFNQLKDKRVCIIGVGSSAFDAAAVALENGSKVDLLTHRKNIPCINKSASVAYAGFSQGYFHLSDEDRWKTCSYLEESGTPPPFEALDRIKGYSQVKVRRDIEIKSAEFKDQAIEIVTNHATFHYDFLILATGFSIDIQKQPELACLKDHVLLWKHLPCGKDTCRGFFPYLGPHFEFKEKIEGTAPFLKHIYCFNYAATLSHGLLSGDIPAISIGAQRLAEGIASDFFCENWNLYKEQLEKFCELEIKEENYPFFD